jgi:hypothetical protein
MCGKILGDESRQRHPSARMTFRSARERTVDYGYGFGNLNTTRQDVDSTDAERGGLAEPKPGVCENQNEQPGRSATRVCDRARLLVRQVPPILLGLARQGVHHRRDCARAGRRAPQA